MSLTNTAWVMHDTISIESTMSVPGIFVIPSGGEGDIGEWQMLQIANAPNNTHVIALAGTMAQKSFCTVMENGDVAFSNPGLTGKIIAIKSIPAEHETAFEQWLTANASKLSFAGKTVVLGESFGEIDTYLEDDIVLDVDVKSNWKTWSYIDFGAESVLLGNDDEEVVLYTDASGMNSAYSNLKFLSDMPAQNGGAVLGFCFAAISIEEIGGNMEYTKIPANTMNSIQLNAGIIVDEFTPETGVYGNILGATTGGFSFAANPTYADFGEDIDNCPPNTWQLKRISSYDPAISGIFVTIDKDLAKRLQGAATSSTASGLTHIVPKKELASTDFEDVWVIGDHTSGNGGFVAIHLHNVLNTAGLQWTTTKDGKGQFAFDFHSHYDFTDPTEEPFEIYVKEVSA